MIGLMTDDDGAPESDAFFFRGTVESDLDECARQVLDALRALLARLRPVAVDPGGTVTRPELGSADFLIGHRDFAGFALAVGAGRQVPTGADFAEVFFVHYDDLGRGDDFDLARGRPHWQFRRDTTESFEAWLPRVMSRVETLLSAPIVVRATFVGDDQRPIKIEILAPEPNAAQSDKVAWTRRSWRPLLRSAFATKHVKTTTTSFDDPSTPFAVPQSRRP